LETPSTPESPATFFVERVLPGAFLPYEERSSANGRAVRTLQKVVALAWLKFPSTRKFKRRHIVLRPPQFPV
jgi:hypothetical protein